VLPEDQAALLDPKTGLPALSLEEANTGSKSMKCALFIMPLMSSVIGVGIACAIHFWGAKDMYLKQIAALGTYTQNQAGYIYLSAWFFARLVNHINLFPSIYKAKIMRGKSGNVRANMFIYKIAGEGDMKNAVVYNEEGDIGSYNRANRSVGHFLENSTQVILSLLLCGFVYALPTMILIIIFCIGRMLH